MNLQHHDTRSFMDVICVIQISTRTQDFLVDTIKLRLHIHAALVPIFHNENIFKVCTALLMMLSSWSVILDCILLIFSIRTSHAMDWI